MHTAQEMYEYCITHGFKETMNKKWYLNHFNLIEQSLGNDENVKMCFSGNYRYNEKSKNSGSFVFAITNKRLLMAQQKSVRQNLQTIIIENINNISIKSGLILAIITINTTNEIINISIEKSIANNIYSIMNNILFLSNEDNYENISEINNMHEEINNFSTIISDCQNETIAELNEVDTYESENITELEEISINIPENIVDLDNISVKNTPKNKNLIYFLIIFFAIIFIVFTLILSSLPSSKPTHIYDNAIVKDFFGSTATTKLGEYSLIEIDSSQVTLDSLTDWYFNYVSKNDFMWCMILYSDKNDGSGVYAANNGLILQNVKFEKKYGGYADECLILPNCIQYKTTKEGTLRNASEPETDYSDNNTQNVTSEDCFIIDAKLRAESAVGAEVIKDIKLKDQTLYIYIDMTKTDTGSFTPEAYTLFLYVSIAEEICGLTHYESLWDTLVIDFGNLGYIQNSQKDIKNGNDNYTLR